MSFFAPPACPYPPGIENLTGAELARLAANEKCRTVVRAEVCRRLKDSPNRANYLTFRWFLPDDEKDRADAFDGLCARCWRATEKRIFPYGLFPRTGLETSGPNTTLLGGSVAKETQEDIRTALVDYLYDRKGLSDAEVILTALNGGFQTDVDVANAVRQGVREKSELAYGDDVISKNGDELTLFEVMLDDPESRTNAYNDLVEIISQKKPQIVEEFGEKGWIVWQEILSLVDSELVCKAETGDCQNERDFDRSLTGVFERVYGVKERWAFTLKRRFLAAIRRIAETVQSNELPGSDRPPSGPASELSPVVPMELIRRTSGMPVISRLLRFSNERGEFEDGWGDNRSSVGRDVPPDEWQEIKARLKGGADCRESHFAGKRY